MRIYSTIGSVEEAVDRTPGQNYDVLEYRLHIVGAIPEPFQAIYMRENLPHAQSIADAVRAASNPNTIPAVHISVEVDLAALLRDREEHSPDKGEHSSIAYTGGTINFNGAAYDIRLCVADQHANHRHTLTAHITSITPAAQPEAAA